MKRYYGVVYLKNGDMCVSRACESEDECVSAMKRAVAKHFDEVKATTYMVREATDDGGFVFGHPKSRDLMQDRKFIKEING